MQSPATDRPAVGLPYLARYFGPYRGLLGLTFLFLLAGRVAATLDPVWLKKIIDGVTQGAGWSALLPLIYVYFGLRILSAIFDCLRDIAFSPVEMGVSRDVSRELFHHLLRLPVGYHHEQEIGGLARQITRGGRAITWLLDFAVMNIVPTIAELFIVTGFLLYLYSPVYALITLGTVLVYTWFTIWATEKRQVFRLGANVADDEVSGVEVDALTNIETVKYFNDEEEMRGRYRPPLDRRHDLWVKSNNLFALISTVQALILLLGLGGILLLALRQTISGQITIGDLVLLTTYLTRLSQPITVLGFVYRSLKDGMADLDGMARILQQPVTIAEPLNPRQPAERRGEVVFDNVSFSYAPGREVLREVSFRVAPGSHIAFVGPSGVGKSTIVKLLFRFFDPDAGRILIDGVDVRELAQEARRGLLAIVPQEPALFNTTIGDNIRFGKPDASPEEVEAAARLANLHTLIAGLPEGYKTLVGERGVKLSGGEKQRVAIARAIIRQPRILVFDEATSSLDSSSERQIQAALERVSAGRTTIAVAHRLSTIADADTIYVLRHGHIVESGRHEELLLHNGLYARLWRIQADPTLDENAEHDVLHAEEVALGISQ